MPVIFTVRGMMLKASPVWIIVTESTAERIGSTLRETMRLQRDDELGGDHHRIDGVVRHRGVTALPFDDDGELVARGHDAAGADAEGAGGAAGHVVHAEDLGDAEALHQAVLDHRAAAGAALFGGLEDDGDGAGEIARLGEIFRGAEQHRGVTVVAAGVHLAGGLCWRRVCRCAR